MIALLEKYVFQLKFKMIVEMIAQNVDWSRLSKTTKISTFCPFSKGSSLRKYSRFDWFSMIWIFLLFWSLFQNFMKWSRKWSSRSTLRILKVSNHSKWSFILVGDDCTLAITNVILVSKCWLYDSFPLIRTSNQNIKKCIFLESASKSLPIFPAIQSVQFILYVPPPIGYVPPPTLSDLEIWRRGISGSYDVRWSLPSSRALKTVHFSLEISCIFNFSACGGLIETKILKIAC